MATIPDPEESLTLRYLHSHLFLDSILTSASEFLLQNLSSHPPSSMLSSSPPGSPITFVNPDPVPPPYGPADVQRRLFFAIRDGSQNLLLTNEYVPLENQHAILT